MKGMVFTEYIEFVEDTFGFDVAQEMIEGSGLSNDGVYTGVGTYDSSELVSMVMKLSELTKIEVSELLTVYGKHLFVRFADLYPHFFHEGIKIFDFIDQIDNYIHVEVQKLYPDAELPSVATIKREADSMEIVYTSKRKFGDFAHGLLLGAIAFFEEDMTIEKKLLVDDGSKVRFILQRK
jgi:hypothetical protein